MYLMLGFSSQLRRPAQAGDVIKSDKNRLNPRGPAICQRSLIPRYGWETFQGRGCQEYPGCFLVLFLDRFSRLAPPPMFKWRRWEVLSRIGQGRAHDRPHLGTQLPQKLASA